MPAIIAAKHAHTETKHHRVEHRKPDKNSETKKRERSHKFTYPFMSLKDVQEKIKAGATFKAATDKDYKDKDAQIYTLKLPKLGYIPFRMTDPKTAPKAGDGTEIKPPKDVPLSKKKVEASGCEMPFSIPDRQERSEYFFEKALAHRDKYLEARHDMLHAGTDVRFQSQARGQMDIQRQKMQNAWNKAAEYGHPEAQKPMPLTDGTGWGTGLVWGHPVE